MGSPRKVAEVGLLLFAIAMPIGAYAQDEPQDSASSEDRQAAAKEFAEGQRAFVAGDYRLAAEQFEAAYGHKPHYAALWNAARARQRAGDLSRAANLYMRYLQEAPPNTRDRNTAQSALRQLASKLGQIEVNAVGLEDVRIDREPVQSVRESASQPSPERGLHMTLYVNPGAHVLEAKTPTSERMVTQSVTVDAGQTLSVALVPPTEPPAAIPVSPTQPLTPPAKGHPKDELRKGTWSPIVVYIGGGLTAVAAGLTVLSGLDVLNQKTAYDKDPSQANLDAGKSKELRTNILLGASVALGVFTGVSAIWLVDWHGSDRARAQVGLGIGQLTVRGTF